MSLETRIKKRISRRIMRVKNRLVLGDRPRVSAFQSLRHVYAQIIDDRAGNTLASCSSMRLADVKGDQKTIAFAVGRELAQQAMSKGIVRVVFDRGRYRYHGCIKALADGLREGGLEF